MTLRRPAFLPDNFVLAIIATVVLASLLPARGKAAIGVDVLANAAITLLFFLHGAKMSREAVVAGLTHWRLHLLILATTFAFFPLLALALRPLLEPLITAQFYLGILCLSALPSTLQASIAFTAIARGNVPAAVCSASASNLIGVVLSPVLMGLLVSGHAGGPMSLQSALRIVLLLLVPFVAGQIARRWIGPWVERRKAMMKWVDQGSILIVVFASISEAATQGMFQQIDMRTLIALVFACGLLLLIVMSGLVFASRRLGFSRADEAAIVFCGSKKSLATGLPMAKILFAGHPIGFIVLPVMVFHQLQLMACAFMARRYASEAEKP